jgi:hypothetical protein
MLFLAGGKSSFKRDPFSSACLFLSICPRFPARTVDNQYHLQATRHLYVLACEQRVLHTLDIDTGLPTNLQVEVEVLDRKSTDATRKMLLDAPGLLPELATVKAVHVRSQTTNEMRIESTEFYCTSLNVQPSDALRNAIPSVESNALFRNRVLVHAQAEVASLFVKQKRDGDHSRPHRLSVELNDLYCVFMRNKLNRVASSGFIEKSSVQQHDQALLELLSLSRRENKNVEVDENQTDEQKRVDCFAIGASIMKCSLFLKVIFNASVNASFS